MPADLKALMRHASIETTMKHYVEIQADDLAGDLWARFGETSETGTVSGTFSIGTTGFEPATS